MLDPLLFVGICLHVLKPILICCVGPLAFHSWVMAIWCGQIRMIYAKPVRFDFWPTTHTSYTYIYIVFYILIYTHVHIIHICIYTHSSWTHVLCIYIYIHNALNEYPCCPLFWSPLCQDKTLLCKFWLKNRCQRQNCNFAHGEEIWRPVWGRGLFLALKDRQLKGSVLVSGMRLLYGLSWICMEFQNYMSFALSFCPKPSPSNCATSLETGLFLCYCDCSCCSCYLLWCSVFFWLFSSMSLCFLH